MWLVRKNDVINLNQVNSIEIVREKVDEDEGWHVVCLRYLAGLPKYRADSDVILCAASLESCQIFFKEFCTAMRANHVFYLDDVIEAVKDHDADDGRNPPTQLDVTMPNGEKICCDDAASTFVEVINKIGRRKVKQLNLEINKKDLMSTSEDDQQRIKLGGYYINVGTSTSRKKTILEDIASRLGVSLEVEIIPK